jgi:CRISPR-associated protein Csb1
VEALISSSTIDIQKINKEKKMDKITLDVLKEACKAGGPSCLTSRTELAPAAGPEAAVAPAKFVVKQGRDNVSTYSYERRYIDGEEYNTVLIDSKQSQLNRMEGALVRAIEDGHSILTKIPRVVVQYERNDITERYSDLELPHRVFDGHIRAGTIQVDGQEQTVTQTEWYRAIRDATPSNARALLDASPATLIFGGWDSSRKARQGRWRSLLVGEIIGVIGVYAANVVNNPSKKGGARIDPVGMQVKLPGEVLKSLADTQKDELSPETYNKIIKSAESKELISASNLGLGGIPPTLDTLAGVACKRIIRAHVFSFAALRQIRFGFNDGNSDGNVACRVLLAALALNALARSDSELFLRANCDLVEKGEPVVTIDFRYGKYQEFQPLSIEEADNLLERAIKYAEDQTDIKWTDEPKLVQVQGNPKIITGAVDEGSEEENNEDTSNTTNTVDSTESSDEDDL